MVGEIISTIESSRLSITNEKRLQAELGLLLTDFSIEREKALDPHNVIDFFIKGIGIEVKVRGNRKAIYKQCVRYCEFPEIDSLILVTSVSMGFPEEINGKPCYVINLSKAWL